MEKRGVPASKPNTDDDDDNSRTKTPRRTSRRTTCWCLRPRRNEEIFSNPILCNGSVCLGFHYSESSIPFRGCVYLSFSFSLVVLALVDHLSFPSSLDTKPFVGVVGVVVTVVVVVVITR